MNKDLELIKRLEESERDKKSVGLERFLSNHPFIHVLDAPLQLYIFNHFNEKSCLGLCEHFNINEKYQKSCALGKNAEANCSGFNYKNCSWYNYSFLVKSLSKELSEKELRSFYSLWIAGIALRYTIKRIEGHLIKHLGEEDFLSNDWVVSADNLKDIYALVKGSKKDSEIIKKYESLLCGKIVSLHDKLEKLLIHYIKHFDISTPVPFKSAGEFREFLDNKDFSQISSHGVSFEPF